MRTVTEIKADLDAVNSAIRGLLESGAIQSYSIAGRNVSKYSLADLRALKKEYEHELAAASETNGGRGRVTFIR